MTTDRNWLIRTTQNQILGPVAKAKVVEFVQKGALGMADEVCSGNGFWFSLKEKDLVEKYLYGDIPQGYNPISESKSVLSKRENPDKTTSLNTAPANKTQVLKPSPEGPSVLPKNEDLEYPDITLVRAAPEVTATSAAEPHEEVKLPNQDDLEFPDITMIAAPSAPSFHGGNEGMQVHAENPRPIEVKTRPVEKSEAPSAEGPIVYPKDDDLAFPDMGELTGASPTHSEEEDLDFKVDVPSSAPAPAAAAVIKTDEKPAVKKGMMDFKNEVEGDANLTLMFDTLAHDNPHAKAETKESKPEKMTTLSLARKAAPAQSQVQPAAHQPEKLLHERKVKASAQPKEVTKDLPKEVEDRTMPEHLKKRNDNYLLYVLIIIVLIILGLFFYYYRNILNKPLPV